MAKYFEIGLEQDLKGSLKGAIENYKLSVENEELIIDAHLNLIVILLEITFDFGVSSDLINNGIYSQEEINEFHDYLNNLIVKSKVLFKSNEIDLWQYCVKSYFDEFRRDDLLEIIEKDSKNLVPYFQLYIFDLGMDKEIISYSDKVEKLKEQLNSELTFKNKYIISLIEGAESSKV